MGLVSLSAVIVYRHYPSFPVTQPPLVFVSEHEVIGIHLVPSVVH